MVILDRKHLSMSVQQICHTTEATVYLIDPHLFN